MIRTRLRPSARPAILVVALSMLAAAAPGDWSR